MKKRNGTYPRVRVEGDGRGVISHSGAVLLIETARKAGLDAAVSAALAPWRKARAVHDPGKVLMDVALAVVLGGDCLADVGMVRAEPTVFGPVASDPTISRLIDTLSAAGAKLTNPHARSRLIRRPWHGLADVELGTAEWVDWFNNQQLHTAIGDIPLHEHETNHYAHHQHQPAAGANA